MQDRRPESRPEPAPPAPTPPRTARRSRIGYGPILVFLAAMTALAPTTGDFGVTWDEPAYRYSQVISAQWWKAWASVRSFGDVQAQMEPDALLYYWPYARYGINFHPPLAGQISLAVRAVVSPWMKDYPSRRMGSVVLFALTITIGCQFLTKRYGPWVGLVMAGSLLLMPRLYGQAHLLDTDIPGLFLWVSTAIAFWNGLREPNARGWRVLVGVLLGLAFLEKMAAVGVLLPLLVWLAVAHGPTAFTRKAGRAAWIDAAVTLGLMLLPLGLAFVEIQLLQRRLPPPVQADLFFQASPRPATALPGAILAAPLAVWFVRRLLARLRPASPIWGVERPALETLTAIAAFAPVVGWLGNPAWWRETIVRMTHYYTLSNDRQGALPDILILYFNQIYKYSLPWHNAWVLAAITVPPTILIAGLAGVVWGLRRIRTDRIPLYFLLHMTTLPVIRMFPTPAHDGVRLFLPTFFFLAAFAGWGAAWAGAAVAKRIRWGRGLTAAVVLAPALVSLVRIHPYELSYYNAFIGGPSGAWARGFELTYWYEVFTPKVIEAMNRELPPNAVLDHLNEKTYPSMQVFDDQQCLGHLRADIKLFRRSDDQFPYVILPTQDSKAIAFTRLLFAMRPWFASEPAQLDGLRVVTIADPVSVSRAWALRQLVDAPDRSPPDPPNAPAWTRAYAPILQRLWGDGLQKDNRLGVNDVIVDWARTSPETLRAAARKIADRTPIAGDRAAERLYDILVPEADGRRDPVRKDLLDQLLRARADGLVDAVDILIAHPDAVVRVITRYGYTDPRSIGGFLDRDQTEERITHP